MRVSSLWRMFRKSCGLFRKGHATPLWAGVRIFPHAEQIAGAILAPSEGMIDPMRGRRKALYRAETIKHMSRRNRCGGKTFARSAGFASGGRSMPTPIGYAPASRNPAAYCRNRRRASEAP
jgi:hypothetical protein